LIGAITLTLTLGYAGSGAIGREVLMERLVTIFNLAARGDMLPPGEIHQIRRALTAGGLCILPSDTCYALAGNPLIAGVPALVNSVLDRHEEKISLSFGSQPMVERYVDLGYREHRLLDAADKSTPITLVAAVSTDLPDQVRRALPAALYTTGELGIRLSQSWIERQVSSELDVPVTSAAIYYADGQPVRSFDDAITIVISGLLRAQNDETPLVAVRHPPVNSKGVSSVVGYKRDEDGRNVLVVFREGAVESRRVIEIAGKLSARDVEDWT